MTSLENRNPAIFGRVSERKVLPQEEDDDIRDEIDAREVFDILAYSFVHLLQQGYYRHLLCL